MSVEQPAGESISAWPSYLFVVQNPDHDFLKDDLLSHIYAYQAQQESAIDSHVAVTAKHQLFESKLNYLMSEQPAVMELKRMLEELITEVATEVNQDHWPSGAAAEANIIESWFHVTQNGGYHDVHSHPNCSWCGIYYLEPGQCDLSQRNGVNRFYDPRINADHYADAGSAYLNQQGFWDFEPVEGQIVIFPSYLKHSALPYFGDQDRVVIAFNAVVDLL